MSDTSDRNGRRQRDFDDLQHEISGADVGRIRRFLRPEDDRSPDGKRKKREKERLRQALADLMRDPEYARVYMKLGNDLRQAETQADAALAALRADVEHMDHKIAEMEADAARRPDGRLVFRDAEGRVLYADGSTVPPEIAEGIQWPAEAPSAEEYFAALGQRQSFMDQLREWDLYRNDVLGGLRNRYDSEDDPMSKNELDAALDDIVTLRPELSTIDTPHMMEYPTVPAANAVIAIPTGLN
ncbi:MAG: hypothetical protein AAFR39_06105 [Pseudomonadota bacterium]